MPQQLTCIGVANERSNGALLGQVGEGYGVPQWAPMPFEHSRAAGTGTRRTCVRIGLSGQNTLTIAKKIDGVETSWTLGAMLELLEH